MRRDRPSQIPNIQVWRRTLQERVERFLHDGNGASQDNEPDQNRGNWIDVRPDSGSRQKGYHRSRGECVLQQV
jgi:hypothetical protein